VGEFDWQQGYDYLLAALARLKKDNIPFKARLVGDGPLYSAFRYSISAASLDLYADVMLDRADPHNVSMMLLAGYEYIDGNYPSIINRLPFYRSRWQRAVQFSDHLYRSWNLRECFFVLPAHMDTEANRAILQKALDAGLRVIITEPANAGGLVRNGENGSIVPARDIPALTQAIIQAIGSSP
jgi:glycosyltransferase involved in cell wall biosynthesis